MKTLRYCLSVVSVVVLMGTAVSADTLIKGTTANTATGTLAGSNASVVLALNGAGSVSVQLASSTGTWTATFSGSIDGVNYTALNMVPLNSSTATTTATGNGLWLAATGGLHYVQVQLTSFSSGSTVVTIRETLGGGLPAALSVSGTNAAAGSTGSAVPSSASYTGINIGGNLTGLTGFGVGTQKAVATAIVDGSGNQITSFGGGTQYATGSAQATPTGTVSLGWDGANVRALSTSSGGVLSVSSAQSGTWTVQPGNTANTTPWLFTGSGTAGSAASGVVSVQGIASMTPLTVSQSGTWTNRVVGNAGAVFDFAGQNASSPANSLLIGGQFNTTPTTLTTGNASPLQLDSAGNLLVNIKAGAAAGGTSSSFGSALPSTGTAAGYTDGTNMQAGRVFDADTGAGTQYVLGANVRFSASGGSVEWGQAGAGIGKVGLFDGSGNAINSTSNSLNVNVTNGSNTVTDAATQTTGAASVASTEAYQFAYNGTAYTRVYVDPCQSNAKSFVSISQTATTQVLGAAGSAKHYYICDVHLVTATAQNVALIDSTTAGNACATSPEGLLGLGGATAGGGWNFAANGGIVVGSGGFSIGSTNSANAALCVAQSSTGQVSGGFSYVVQ